MERERKRRPSGKSNRRKTRLTSEQFRALAQEQFEEVAETGGRTFGLSIRWRFAILMALLTAFTAVVATLAIVSLQRANQQAEQVVAHHLQPIEQLTRLKSYVYETHLGITQAQANQLPFYLATASESLDRNIANISRSWAAVKDSLNSPAERVRATDLNLALEDYQIAARLYLDSLLRRARVSPAGTLASSARAQTRFTERQMENLYTEIILKRHEEIVQSLDFLVDQRVQTGNQLVAASIDAYNWRVRILGFVAIGGLALLGFLFFLFTGQIVRPLRLLQRAVRALSHGDLSRRRLPMAQDEIGQVALGVHQLTNSLRRVAGFASEIGEGQFRSEFQPLGESDQLGVALTNMRDRLQEVVEEDRRRNWSIAGFAQFSEILRLSESQEHLAERVISALAKYIEANQGAFFLLDDEDPQDVVLRMVASYAYNKKKFTVREFRMGEGFVGQAAIEREPIYVSDVPTDYVTMTSGLGESSPKSLLIVPLVYNDVVYGVVEFASFTRFREWEVDFVKRLSETIGAALANLKAQAKTLRLLDESQKLSGELQSQQQALLETNRSLEASQTEIIRTQTELKGQISALNNAAIVSETNLEGDITFANDQFLRVSRYAKEDLIGKSHRILKSDTTPPEVFLELWDTISRGKVWKGELRNKARDGTYYWVEASITPVLDANGKPVKYISVQFDVTNQKIQEEQIRTALEESMAQEEELRQNAEELEAQQEEMKRTQIELVGQISALNNAAIVSEADLQGRIITVNDSFISMGKYTREELIGQNHRILKSGHQSDDLYESLWKMITQGEVWKGEFKNRAKDGSFYWVTASITPVIDSAGNPVKYIGVQFDITAQKLQEEQIRAALEISQAQEAELRQNAEELQAAQEEMRKTQIELRGQIGALNNAGIVAEADLRGNITLVNEEFTRISKYPREELIGQNHRMLKSGYHSDEFYIDLWDTLVRGQVWQGIFRNRAADGTYYWVKSSVTPVLGFDGKPVKYIGVSFDITAQVLQEEKIQTALETSQAQEEQLRHNAETMRVQQVELDGRIGALNNSGLVTETDPQGNIIFVNEAVVATWGYDRDELIGQNHRIVKSGEHDEAFFAEMWQRITAGQVWKGEVKNRSKDGTDFWVLLTISPVMDASDDGDEPRIVKFIAVAYDITKQKRQASRIRQFLELSQQQEEELRSAAARLQTAQVELKGQLSALNNAALVSETDLEGRITFVNDEATYLWGYSREELVGKPHSLLKSDQHGPDFFTRMWDKLTAGFIWRGEIKNRAKDGSEFWEELTITPVLDAEGKPYKYIGVAFDITKNKNQALRIRQELRKAEEQEAAFRDQIRQLQAHLAAGGGGGAVATGATFELTLDLYGNVRSANETMLQRTQLSPEDIRRCHFTDLCPDTEAERLNELGLWTQLLQADQVQEVVTHADAEGGTFQVRYTFQVVLDSSGQPSEFAASGVELIPALAPAALPEPDPLDRIARAEHDALLRSAWVLVVDDRGLVEQVSGSLLQAMGATPDDLRAQRFSEWLPSETAEAITTSRYTELAWTGMLELPRPNQAPLPVQALVLPVPDARRTLAMFLPLPEPQVVERVVEVPVESAAPLLDAHALEALVQANATEGTLPPNLALLDEMAVLSETDLQGNITYVNEAFCQLSGYPADQLLGQNHRLLRAAEMPAGVFFDMWATISRGKRWTGEVLNQAADGRQYWLQLTVIPVLNAEGKPERYLGVGFDISSIKKPGTRMHKPDSSRVFQAAEPGFDPAAADTAPPDASAPADPVQPVTEQAAPSEPETIAEAQFAEAMTGDAYPGDDAPEAPAEPAETEPAGAAQSTEAAAEDRPGEPQHALPPENGAATATEPEAAPAADDLPAVPAPPADAPDQSVHVPEPLRLKRDEVRDKQSSLDVLLQQLADAPDAAHREEVRRQAFYEEQELRALQIELALLEQQHTEAATGSA